MGNIVSDVSAQGLKSHDVDHPSMSSPSNSTSLAGSLPDVLVDCAICQRAEDPQAARSVLATTLSQRALLLSTELKRHGIDDLASDAQEIWEIVKRLARTLKPNTWSAVGQSGEAS